jgi:hypothetical protein
VIRKEEGSSATDSLSEDVTGVRKKEERRRKKEDAIILQTAIPISHVYLLL